MKSNRSYRFITFILIGLLSVAFSQSFAKIVKVEKAKTEQGQPQDQQDAEHEHVLKTYEAVISVDQNILSTDDSFLPSNDFPDELEIVGLTREQVPVSVLPYFEVLFETSICTNAP